jgi:oligosaccharyl transferase (archaeosortase A-associated)
MLNINGVEENEFHLIPKSNFGQILLLIVFAAIMFFLRTVPIHHLIITKWPGEHGNFINFSADDAVYHMRLVHNTINHWPWRIFFDPFTHFPFGDTVHFGPLFTLIIATTALIIGLGNPSAPLINLVGAYTPVIMGVLCLIPVYFIVRNLFGKNAAIFCSFILTFLPGEFLQRSTIGFTDHHIAETLFSTISCCFLIYALIMVETPSNENHKKFLKYTMLSAITFGLFLLIWPAALMFGVIFLIFFLTQLIINHNHNIQTKHLSWLAVIIFTIPSVMVLPYSLLQPSLKLQAYSLTQPLTLMVLLTIFFICYITHIISKRNKSTAVLYPIILFAEFLLIGVIACYLVPELTTTMKNGWKMLFDPGPGMRTISEVHPSILNQDGDKFSLEVLWHTYYISLFFSLCGLAYLCCRVYKKLDPREIFFLIWTIAIIFAAMFQRRFNYYLAINVAILTGGYFIYPILNFLSGLRFRGQLISLLQKISIPILTAFFMLLIIDPILTMIIGKNMPIGSNISSEEYNTFMWLKYHTPNPEGEVIDKSFDYASGFYSIPDDLNAKYKHKDSAYGIMAWWDIGHQLTYIAKRAPNSNPFQSGVIEKDKKLGAALFFTSQNEEKALENIEKSGSRYVVIENRNTINLYVIGVWCDEGDSWRSLKKVDGTFQKNQKIQNITLNLPIDSKKYLQSMISRLYYYDANGLKHFRLIHESDGDYVVVSKNVIFKPKFATKTKVLEFQNYEEALENAAKINKMLWINNQNNQREALAYEARPPVKRTKIFEKVRGAIISGKVKGIKDHSNINITLKLKTKFNRIFIYKQSTKVIKGHYKFIVPYPTYEMIGKDYFYDIIPIGKYQIRTNNKIHEVDVPENAVMKGENIKVNL